MAANIAIGIAKFIGAAISGSSAMMSEGIHSIVDSVNEILLLYGIEQSKLAPDEQYPLGRGQELYFWSLMVGVLIFALGGGISIYEGFHSLQHLEPSKSPMVSYVVLGMSAIFESIALFISVREFKKNFPLENISLWESIRRSKDPSSFIVIMEDSAALVGLFVAFMGIILSEIMANPIYDAIASIVIGIILIIVATLLVAETKGLIVGESASPETRESIKNIVISDEAVSAMEPPITLHFGPKDIMLALNIEFLDELSADEIEAAVRRIEGNIRNSHQEVKRIFIEAASMNYVHK